DVDEHQQRIALRGIEVARFDDPRVELDAVGGGNLQELGWAETQRVHFASERQVVRDAPHQGAVRASQRLDGRNAGSRVDVDVQAEGRGELNGVRARLRREPRQALAVQSDPTARATEPTVDRTADTPDPRPP